jgi:hypothetical protein
MDKLGPLARRSAGRPAAIAAMLAVACLLSGCGVFYVAALGVAEMLNPDPVSSIEIVWAKDTKTCRAIVGGDAMHAFLRGTLSRRNTPISTVPAAKTTEADWRVVDDEPSFVVLAGRKETVRSDARPRWQPRDAARSYYDFNNDGLPDLGYEVFGPPDYLPGYVALPADDDRRLWFESRLGSLPPDWQAQIAAHDGHVLAVSVGEMERIDGEEEPYYPIIEAYPYLAPVFFDGSSYLLKLEERLKFDPSRTSPPLTFGDAEDDASAFKTAAHLTLYRVTEDYALTEECKFLEQRMESFQASS